MFAFGAVKRRKFADSCYSERSPRDSSFRHPSLSSSNEVKDPDGCLHSRMTGVGGPVGISSADSQHYERKEICIL